MNPVVARLTLRGLLGRRRAGVLALLPALLLVLAGTIRLTVGTDDAIAAGLLGRLGLGTILPLLAMIAGTGAIGPEIDDGSIVYVLAKPLSRISIAVTKWLVAVGIVMAFAVAPMLLAGYLLAGRPGDLVLGYTVATAVAGVAYCALFLLLAVLTRNSIVVGLLYALVWESVIGGYVPGAQTLSVQQWAMSLAVRITGSRAAELHVTSAVGLATGVTLLVLVTVSATWYAGWRLRSLRLTSEL